MQAKKDFTSPKGDFFLDSTDPVVADNGRKLEDRRDGLIVIDCACNPILLKN